MARPGVLFRFDLLDAIEQLDPTDAGLLFLGAMRYGKDGTPPTFQNPLLSVVWPFIKTAVDHDAETYNSKVSQKKYAVYVRESKKAGLEPMDFDAWKASADITRYQPISGDIHNQAHTQYQYHQHLTAAFTETTGRRTEKQRRDPLDAAVSLDTPVTQEDPEGPTLGDAIPDAQAAAAFQEAEQRTDNSRLRAALMGAVNTLPREQRAAVVGKYWRGERVNTLALGKALRALRRPMVSAGLRAYL